MPTPEQILATLTSTANEFRWLAIAWHVIVVAGFLLGARPPRRLLGVLLTLPLLSVSLLAMIAGNLFNFLVFLVASILLAVLAVRLPFGPVRMSRIEERLAGIAMIAFGLVYPHFLYANDWWEYLYAAPLGLVPCPTLSLAIGVALACGGFGAKAWPRVLAVFGLFYGLFGALRLDVQLDWALTLGALVLLVQSGRSEKQS